MSIIPTPVTDMHRQLALSCGELSCDECNARTASLTAELNRLRSDRDCEKRLRKDAEEFRENAIARAELAEAELSAEQEKCDKLLSVLVYADQILDDIDTCSDAHKPMYSTYSQNVFKLCIKGRDARRAAIDAAIKEGAK